MPIIPVTVSLGRRFVVTEALVDSGAGRSIFDAQFARELGIAVVESGKRAHFEGVTGHRLTAYCHDVTLIIGGNDFSHVCVAFCDDMPDNAMNILGQEDFFSMFPIKFTFRKKEVTLMSGD